MVAQPMGPVYNNLIHFDPHKYPEIIGDLAKSWTVSDDHLTYTFTLHEGVKFHDGSELTSADVKASWDRIVFPTDGVISPRRSNYQMVKSIEAPDRATVVFRLQHPSPSFLSNMAHPANFIYAKKYLDSDVQYYKTHTVGTGPFKLKNYTRVYHRAGAQRLLEKGAALSGWHQVFHHHRHLGAGQSSPVGTRRYRAAQPPSGGCGWHHGAAGR